MQTLVLSYYTSLTHSSENIFFIYVSFSSPPISHTARLLDTNSAMKSLFSSIRSLRRLQNKAPGVRIASPLSQLQGHQRGPAAFLLIGLLLGGAATTSAPKLTLASNSIVDTPPRWSGITREPLLQSKYADEKTMLKVSHI